MKNEKPPPLVELTVQTPDGALAEDAAQALNDAEAFRVTTREQYQAAANQLALVKGKARHLDAEMRDMLAPVKESELRIRKWFSGPLDFLTRAEASLKAAMVNYTRDQERIAREQQAKLDEQARKEREKLEERARKAAEQGKSEQADKLQTKAACVVAPVVAPVTPQVEGVSMREVWRFVIEDAAKIPREFLCPDEKRIGQYVRAMKEDAAIAGVRVIRDLTLASRAES